MKTMEHHRVFNNPVLGYTTEYYSAMIEYQKKKSDKSSEVYAVHGFMDKGNIFLGKDVILNPKAIPMRDKSNVNKKSKLHLNGLEKKSKSQIF